MVYSTYYWPSSVYIYLWKGIMYVKISKEFFGFCDWKCHILKMVCSFVTHLPNIDTSSPTLLLISVKRGFCPQTTNQSAMTSISFQLTTVVAILRARQAKHHGELQIHEYGHLLAWLPPGSRLGHRKKLRNWIWSVNCWLLSCNSLLPSWSRIVPIIGECLSSIPFTPIEAADLINNQPLSN